jgi:2,4-dienoyl-CoA reductase-like NADH-dependent reductase (Old Yellow Enzyme family)/thioredoxin reductase
VAGARGPVTTGSDYAHLLAPGRIGSLALRNRIAMAPMGSNLCEPDGHPGERMLAYFEARARGGVGLVIVEVAAICWPVGAANPNQLGISDDAFVPDLARLVERIHAHGAKAALQLQHAGRVATRDIAAGRPLLVPSEPPPMAVDLYRDLAPEDVRSATADFARPGAKLHYRVMDADDIAALRRAFADAAERAQRAGFDGIELHAGHGYLLSAFLSPHYNRRGDAYGGPLEGRARLLLETIREVRERVGAGFPLWARLDARELRVPDGISAEDARRTAELAEAAGLDAIHVSAYADPGSGSAFTEAPLVHARAGFAELAAGIKRRVAIPVIAVGRLEPEDADALIARGDADFVAMGRKLLADPDLPRKLAEGRRADVRPCIYAYRCVGNVFLTKRAHCVVNPSTGREHELPPRPARAERPRRLLVIGGGPAGLEAARVAAERGHRVALYEREPELGGAARLASLLEEPIGELVAWLERSVREVGVELHVGAALDADAAAALGPEAVVVATGARRAAPSLPGANGGTLIGLTELRQALEDGRLLRGPVAVWGGGSIGLELAEHLVARGARVALVEASARFGAGMAPPRLWRALHALRAAGASLLSRRRVAALEPGALVTVDAEGRERRVPAACLIDAAPGEPDGSLVAALAARGLEAHAVGDCTGPGWLEAAFREAQDVARRL